MTEPENWRQLYRAAMVEVIPEKIHKLINVARRAIIRRHMEMRLSGSINSEELRAMGEALNALNHWEDFNRE